MSTRNPRQQVSVHADSKHFGRLHVAARRAGLATMLVLTGTVALSAVAVTSAQAKAAKTLTFLSYQQSVKPFSLGVVLSDVNTTTAGKTIGADTLICLHAAPRCSVDLDFAGGSVFVLSKQTKTGAVGTIVGGTGSYKNATGTVLVKNRTKTMETVTLTLT